MFTIFPTCSYLLISKTLLSRPLHFFLINHTHKLWLRPNLKVSGRKSLFCHWAFKGQIQESSGLPIIMQRSTPFTFVLLIPKEKIYDPHSNLFIPLPLLSSFSNIWAPTLLKLWNLTIHYSSWYNLWMKNRHE